MDRIPFGIRQLDTIIDGGAPPGSVVLLSGESGAGSREFMYTSAVLNGLATADQELHDLYYGNLDAEASVSDEIHYVSFTADSDQLYREMDRTMDPAPGLLDRRCNPTSAFHALRALNTVLFGEERRWRHGPERTVDGVDLLGLECADLDVWLALPPVGSDPVPLDLPGGTRSTGRRWTVSLMDATSRSGSPGGDVPATVEIDGPTLVAVETGNATAP
jgi:hypothetical protein